MRSRGRTVLWRRLDQPGHEFAALVPHSEDWRLHGVAVFATESGPCSLAYLIECDRNWHTRSAVISGWVAGEPITVSIESDGAGSWRLNGVDCPAVRGCVDIDLAFSPSTNLLPIRRLNLHVGSSALVRAAWLAFPLFALEPLEQRYERLDDNRYQYESGNGAFRAVLQTNGAGFVVDYPGLWQTEPHRHA